MSRLQADCEKYRASAEGAEQELRALKKLVEQYVGDRQQAADNIRKAEEEVSNWGKLLLTIF